MSDYFVKFARVVFADMVEDLANPCFENTLAENDFDNIALLDVVRRLDGLSVDAHMRIVASVVGDGSAFDKARNLKEFVNSHYLLISSLRVLLTLNEQ